MYGKKEFNNFGYFYKNKQLEDYRIKKEEKKSLKNKKKIPFFEKNEKSPDKQKIKFRRQGMPFS